MEGESHQARAPRRTVVVLCVLTVAALLYWLGTPGPIGGEWLGDAIRDVRGYNHALGWLGLPLYWFAGTLAIIVNIPAIVVITIAAVIYGTGTAIFLGLACLVPAAWCIHFIGHKIARRWVGCLFARHMPRLENHFARSGLATVVYARLAFFALPPVNWALAVMNIRARDYVLGTAIGGLPHVLAWAWVTGTAAELLARGQTLERTAGLMVPLLLGAGLILLLQVTRSFIGRGNGSDRLS